MMSCGVEGLGDGKRQSKRQGDDMTLRTRLLIAGLIGVHGLICVSLTMWVWLCHRLELSDEYAIQARFFLQGLAIGQANLLAFWAVFASGSIVWRWTSAAFLTTLSWFLIVGTANLFFDPETDVHDAWSTALVALQVPMLMVPTLTLRYFRKLRYVPPGQSADLSKGFQISLRELLLSMAVVGPTLVMLRGLHARGSLSQLFVILSILIALDPWMLLALLATNLLAVLPCLWVTTSKRFPPLQWVAVLPIATLAIWQMEFTVISLELANLEPAFAWRMLTSSFAQGLSACVTLAILRWHGFRWVSLRSLPAIQPVASVLPGDDNTTSLAASSHLAEGPSP